jgi:hypothetical protein
MRGTVSVKATRTRIDVDQSFQEVARAIKVFQQEALMQLRQ